MKSLGVFYNIFDMSLWLWRLGQDLNNPIDCEGLFENGSNFVFKGEKSGLNNFFLSGVVRFFTTATVVVNHDMILDC